MKTNRCDSIRHSWQQPQDVGPTRTHWTSHRISGNILLPHSLCSFLAAFKTSSPPLSVLFGIIFGPYVLDWITPRHRSMEDDTVQELARIVVGLQFFAVGLASPRLYFNRHWKSVPWFLVPIMTSSWAIHFSLRIPYISNRHPCCSHYWRLSSTNGSYLRPQCVVKIDIQ